ncbi:hypothetical protein MMG00_10675 [Ignatzschineria rhizosphaerae]|uniref:Mu-like prophage I protein n=1 Tax=Ignatzschineria rhizosphaerae TaxID=2923279 RepID=A0ABY3X6P5_9GAMM|nr:phage protease [Ignatzschineria rhizosphaerae]UNM95673.1 hypothetical protein MMG00_10675 [Ignatzschineria rhizosphaerae]
MSSQKFGIAFLHSTLAQEDGWRQVLPSGHFRAKDGRPSEKGLEKGWFLNKEIAERLINQVKAKGKVMVDYEHAYLHALTNAEKGKPVEPTIASGWIYGDDIKWEDGLWVKPRWTKKAKSHVDDGELAGLSALFTYDLKTGEPLNFLNVALTNDPALTELKGLTNLAALSKFAALSLNSQSTTGDNSMNEYLLKILGALGLEATEENIAEVSEQAVEKINSLIAKEASSEETIADLKAKQVDPVKYVPREAFEEAKAKIAALSKTTSESQVDALIAEGRKTGKVMKSEVGNLKDIAKVHGLAVLKATIDSRVAIAGLSDESQIIEAAVDAVISELTEEQKEAARMLGIDEAEYLKILIEQEGA